MNSLLLLLALAIICLPAWVILERIVPVTLAGRWLLLAGYSLVLGMVTLTLLMRLLSALDITFSTISIGLASGFIVAVGLMLPASWRLQEGQLSSLTSSVSPSRLAYLLSGFCLAMIALRLLALGIEVGSRPLFSWDAKQHWTKQAKVFYELGSTASFVPLAEWLTANGAPVYTNMHPDYPITTPLLQTWTNIALGQWHDSLMNLPWILMFIGLGLIFYSQLRAAGLNLVSAAAGTYLVLSLPYLNTHVALAGYADLLLACCFLASLSAFANWCQSRSAWQLTLALLSACACLMIKNEGFYWFLSLLPGFVVALMGLRRGLSLLTALFLLLLLLLWLMPGEMVIAGHSLTETDLRYRPQGWLPIVHSFLLHDNWHFLPYLFLVALLALPFIARRLARPLFPIAIALLSALGLYLALYLMTKHSAGAVHFTSLNRVALQLMPAAAFFTLLVYGALLRQSDEKLSPSPGPGSKIE